MDLHAPDERVGELRQLHDVGRARQQEPPGAAVAIHIGLDGEHELGRPLNLVEHKRALCASQEPGWVGSRGRQRRGVVESNVSRSVAMRGKVLRERALAGLARAMQHDDRRVAEGGEQVVSEMARLHGTFLKIAGVGYSRLDVMENLSRTVRISCMSPGGLGGRSDRPWVFALGERRWFHHMVKRPETAKRPTPLASSESYPGRIGGC